MSNSFIVASSSIALPASAGSASTGGIKVSNVASTGGGELMGEHDFILSLPTLDATQLPQNETVVYVVEHDYASDFSTVATLYPVIAQQVGGSSGGADAQSVMFRCPSDTKTYVRVTAITSTNAGDCSTVSMTLNFNM